MTKRMLIDATHEEETRVAVMDGDRLVEFDYESKFRKALKGSIFLAKVTRVEPSLQAAFVNFGGNRHGFLPFSEIHPDYFRIPIADREALIAEQEELMRRHEEEEESEEESGEQDAGDDSNDSEDDEAHDHDHDHDDIEDAEEINGNLEEDDLEDEPNGNAVPEDEEDDPDGNSKSDNGNSDANRRGGRGRGRGRQGGRGGRGGRGGGRHSQSRNKRPEKYEDDYDDEQRFRFNLRRKYKIQEVIKRGQIMLVQVSKEERGNKGAAVSSYLSLPGRYCVLMPNSPRAGGISRKIANYKDRAKMREIIKELNVPKGMSVIVRTAGVSRTKTEIKRDLDYLMRLWDNIRDLTLQSSAPALVYEEADLIKRAVRDLYTRDVEDIVVAGEEGYKNAKSFMKMMIPSHVKRVQEYKGGDVPLFTKYKAERQISEIGETQVTLPSGGYLVINPTEALVSVDVNSGKATKERHIEETALKTNLEAAEEIARQLKLRDLGGLVVIDFIDMEVRRNNGKVERKMRDALSGDRARVQVGRISSFGLMELSRQRLNPSLNESQFEICEHCAGTGRTRTSDATAIMVLRAIEDEGMKGRAAQVIAHVPNDVAIYILNNKNKNIIDIEKSYNMSVLIRVDESVGASQYRVEVSKPSGKAGDDKAEDSAGGDDKKSEGGERKGRRRGRRGGRGRGRRGESSSQSLADDLNENQASVEDDDKNAGKDTKSDKAASSEKKDEKPKKPSAAPKKDEKKSAAKDDKKPAKKDDDGPAVSNDDKKSDTPKSKPEPKAEKTEKTEKTEKAAPKKKEPAAYETVNAAPEKKKKGWWSR